MRISSPDFNSGEYIPAKFTCSGENISPTLIIDGVPEGTTCLALIMDDPDAPKGTFVHWVVWNITFKAHTLEHGTLPVGAVEGTNGAGQTGYMGPCPPSGTHRYFFKLYALDSSLDLPSTSGSEDLEMAMNDHIVAQAELVGLYSKEEGQ